MLRVLHKNHVAIKKLDNETTELTKGDALYTTLLTETVPRWIIQWLARCFDIELIEFYEIPPGSLFKDDDDPV